MKYVRHLGQGVYSSVWLVEKEGKEFALKEFFSDVPNLLEPYLLLEGKHPHLLKGEDFALSWKREKVRVSILQEVADKDLIALVEKQTLSKTRKLEIFRQFLTAINYLHSNHIYHGDIKPDNIFIKEEQVKLGDFGLSSFFSSKQYTFNSIPVAPPEVLRERTNFSTRLELDKPEGRTADLWACGCILFYLMTNGGYFLSPYNPSISMTRYLEDPSQYLLEHGIEEELIPLINSFLHPLAKSRSSAEEVLERFFACKPLIILFPAPSDLEISANEKGFSQLEEIIDYFNPKDEIVFLLKNFFLRLKELREISHNETFLIALLLFVSNLYKEPYNLKDFLTHISSSIDPELIKHYYLKISRKLEKVLYLL